MGLSSCPVPLIHTPSYPRELLLGLAAGQEREEWLARDQDASTDLDRRELAVANRSMDRPMIDLQQL